MLLSTSLRATVLRLTKKQSDLDAALLEAALHNRSSYAVALLDAGADLHAASDHALRTAAMMGYYELFEALVKRYDASSSLDILKEIRTVVAHLSNRERYADLLTGAICDANIVAFAEKRQARIKHAVA